MHRAEAISPKLAEMVQACAMPRKSRVDSEALANLVRRRDQVVRRREIERCGMPSQTISSRTRSGKWQRILPGIIVTFSGMISGYHRIRAALLYAGPGGAILTGISALKLRGLRDLPSDSHVHVLVPHGRRRLSTSFVIVERTRRRPDHSWIQGIPCAPVARAVVDAARRMSSVDAVRAMLAEAVQRHLCTIDDLVREVGAAGNRGTALAQAVLEEVKAGIRSVAEAKARTYLARAGIPAPLWNHDLFDADGAWIARPDAYWPEFGVVLEIDSMAWHLSPQSYQRTQARQAAMTKLGLLVIPVSPTALINDTQAVIELIRATLETARFRSAPNVYVRPAA
jgi:hypothetical protein